MADWQSKLDLSDLWDQFNDGEIGINKLSLDVAKRLKSLRVVNDEEVITERDEIVDEFETISFDEELTIDEFDNVLERLYDWGDISLDGKFGGEKVCWINTF